MRWIDSISKFLACILFLSFVSNAYAIPWYQVKNAEDLEINIFFEKASLEIRPVYNFHLSSLAKVLRKNQNLKLIVQHSGRNGLSIIRAGKIRDYFSKLESVEYARIDIQQGLPSTDSTSLGEKVFLSLTKIPIPPKVKTPKPEILSEEVPDASLLDDEALVKDNSKRSLYGEHDFNRLFSLGYRHYSFSNVKNAVGVTADLELNYRVAENMFLGSEFGYAQLISGDHSDDEYSVKLGFDVDFENINLKTRIYHLTNQVYNPFLFTFETVSDYGLDQKIELKLYKGAWGALKLGFSGNVSFSNNLSTIDSANVFGYNTDLSLVIGKSRFRSSLYFSNRKYQLSGEGFDTRLWGLLLGFYF